MIDTLQMMLDYVLSAFRQVSTESWLILAIGTAAIFGMWYKNTDGHKERVVSRRKMKTRHRQVLDLGQQAMTEAIEGLVTKKEITEDEAKKLYVRLKLKMPELKELGPEPTFGKPHYIGPAPIPSPAKVKFTIISRLQRTGLSAKEVFDKITTMRKSKAQLAKEEVDNLVASLNRK